MCTGRSDFKYIKESGKCYREHPVPVDWFTAVGICSADNAILLEPVTTDEQNFLAGKFKTRY